MSFYNRRIMPWLVDCACSLSAITTQREKVVPQAQGVVLEIGIGSGLNLPLYNPHHVRKIIGLDPDENMWKRSRKRRIGFPIPIERVGLSGEQIPLNNQCVDTVLVTYSLCTIPDPIAALKEMRRVLKPEGKLLFLEHGEAPDERTRQWQKRIDPIWKRLAGGCHSGRPILHLIEESDWYIENQSQAYIKGPKPLAYNYWGSARTKK